MKLELRITAFLIQFVLDLQYFYRALADIFCSSPAPECIVAEQWLKQGPAGWSSIL
jgi:hypothetical protein